MRSAGAALLALSLAACATRPAPMTVAELDWLVGTFESVEGDTRNVETWQLDGEWLMGANITWEGGHEVHRETLQILVIDGTLVYRAKPRGQAANDFRLVAHGEGHATFEDPEHDWPQRIEYRLEGARLRARVSGSEAGSPRSATWTWTRQRP